MVRSWFKGCVVSGSDMNVDSFNNARWRRLLPRLVIQASPPRLTSPSYCLTCDDETNINSIIHIILEQVLTQR